MDKPPKDVGVGGRPRAADEKFCESCGQIVKVTAAACPHCGVPQRGAVSKSALLLITFLLGSMGGHKFYLRRYRQAVVYLLFSWTGIPALLALIEFITYAFTKEDRLRAKYPAGVSMRPVVILACAVGGFVLLSVAAAVAIPLFLGRGARAYEAALKAELENVVRAEQIYFQEHNTYTGDLGALAYEPGVPDVVIRILSADPQCFQVEGSHPRLRQPLSADCHGVKAGRD